MADECGRSWFVVLPDCEPAPAVLAKLGRIACRRTTHASGRTWVMGCWRDDEVTVADSVMVIGTSGATPGRLARQDSLDGLDKLAGCLTGSAHLVASIGGRVRVQGTVSGARQVFHADVDGMTVAADQAVVLAWLTGAVLDDEWVATRLIYPSPPHPLYQLSPWRDVARVPADSYLVLDGTASARTVRWWSAPEPTLGLREGAARLREALLDAVAARVRPGETVAADLSGGMDSTSLCFVAAEVGARLVTVTLDWGAGGSEDARYADLAAAALAGSDPDGLQRLVYRTGQLPAYFDEIRSVEPPLDEPIALVRERAQQRVLAREMRAHGARHCLTGHGGDHVVMAPSSYVHTVLRRDPWTGLAHARAFRALERWPLASTLWSLADGRSYGSWLGATAETLTKPIPFNTRRMETWGRPVRLPPWATEGAVETVRDVIRRAAATAEPLAPGWGQHGALYFARMAGLTAGQIERGMTRAGIPTTSPFCDDRVIEACLAVRLHDRSNPWDYKPLLVEAMRGLVPGEILARRTKDNTSAEWHQGLDRNRGELAALVEESHLAGRGMIDRDALLRTVLSPGLSRLPAPPLENTLALETWLRDIAHHHHPEENRVHSPAF